MAHEVSLRKVGGSVMLTIPPALLDLLGLSAGGVVEIGLENGRLVIEPKRRPRYTLDELLAQCAPDEDGGSEDRSWLDAPAAGREAI